MIKKAQTGLKAHTGKSAFIVNNRSKENTMGKFQQTAVALAIVTALAACGQTRGERALSGGAIGAGAGAVGGAILGADPVTGAIVGGAVGAGTGAVTKPDEVDLGKPVWK